MIDWLSDIFLYHEDKPMIFTTLFFWGFFTVCLFGYSFLYKKPIIRNLYLFIFSLFFYYKSGGYFFSLLLFTTLLDYSVGRLIGVITSPLKRKLVLSISIAGNLSILAYFKYSYFFVDITNQLLGTHFKVVNLFAEWTNSFAGTHFDINAIILPVGISFYTFQSMSYVIDVYRKKLPPVKNIIDYSFYVTFFPQLLAGPIARASVFIPQIYSKFILSKQEFGYALFLILSGLMKKMIISDYISLNFVDRIFDNPMTYTGFENLMGVYGYALQIYCDFSGYTDIAIGIALILGFRLPINFNSPYKATSITDFWKRWHISLSSWFRDYVFLPIAYSTSRKLPKEKYLGLRADKVIYMVATTITFLLCGLWHGASIRFVLWGGIHGIALVFHKLWKEIFPSKKKKKRWLQIAGIVFTFHLVCFAWILFRAHDMNTAGIILNQIFTSFGFALIPEMVISYWLIFAILSAGFAIHWLPSKIKEQYRGLFIKTPMWVKVIICVLVIVIIYQAKSSDIQPFIYFQF